MLILDYTLELESKNLNLKRKTQRAPSGLIKLFLEFLV